MIDITTLPLPPRRSMPWSMDRKIVNTLLTHVLHILWDGESLCFFDGRVSHICVALIRAGRTTGYRNESERLSYLIEHRLQMLPDGTLLTVAESTAVGWLSSQGYKVRQGEAQAFRRRWVRDLLEELG